MVKTTNSNVDIKINGEDNVRSLIRSLCMGYWLSKDEDSKTEFINNLFVSDLSIRLPSQYSYTDILHNKEFDSEAYDFIMKTLNDMPSEDLQINSSKVEVILNKSSLTIDLLNEDHSYFT